MKHFGQDPIYLTCDHCDGAGTVGWGSSASSDREDDR